MNLKKNVVWLGIISFLNDLSSEMIKPLLPLFLTALGGNGFIVGLVGGLRESVSNFLKVLGGYWSDKFGKRKIFVVSGYSISAFFKFLLSFSTHWVHVLGFSSLERIGKGIRTAPRDALIAESMPKEKGKGFGIHRALDTSGAILGSILVILLYWQLNLSFNQIILIASLLAFISLFPFYWVKEIPSKKSFTNFKLAFQKLSFDLRMFILISTIFSLSNFTYMFFVLRAQQFFSGKLSVLLPLFLYSIFNILYASFSIPAGILSDKIGRGKVIRIGYLLFSLVCLGFVFANSFLPFLFLFAFYGMVYALVNGNQRAYVSDLSSPDLKATSLGIFHTLNGIAMLCSSLVAGILWQANPSLTFLYGSVLSLVSFLLFWLWDLCR